MAKRIVKLPPGTAPVFGEPLPTVAAPPKERLRTRGEEVGVVSGQVAGISRECEAIVKALEQIKLRCAMAMTARDILKPEEDATLSGIAEECAAVKTTIEEIWRDTQRMCDAGIGVEKKEESVW